MDNSTCSVDGCGRSIKNKTHKLCDPHYKRYWRNGDVQAHIPIPEPRKAPRPVIDFPDGTRICQDCDARLPLSDFHNDVQSPDGKRKTCKACRTAVETARHHADPERVRLRVAAHRNANREHVRRTDMQRYERNKEKRIAIATAQSHVRRARKANQPYERGVTVPALRKIQGDQCCYCGITMLFMSFPKGKRDPRQATLEHRLAISKGGAHTFANCAIACWGCNSSKGNRTLEDWQLSTRGLGLIQ